jgi:protein phosphatase
MMEAGFARRGKQVDCMGVLCPECGCGSGDPEVCECCNTDLHSPTAPALSSPGPDLFGLPPELLATQTRRLARPEAAVHANLGGRLWRCHWIAEQDWPAWRPQVEQRLRLSIPSLPQLQVLPAERGIWVLAEASGTRVKPWVDWPALDRLDVLEHVANFAEQLARALEDLHAAGLVWLNFNPLAVEEVGGRLRFTNLDLSVHPAGERPPNLLCLPSFLAPEVALSGIDPPGPRTDVFHLALFVYYAIGQFLPHGFFGKGLGAFDFDLPPLRVFEPRLPVGLAPVVHRGLAFDPCQRPATPGAWSADLRAALVRARVRSSAEQPITWEAGFHTRAGRSKSALGRPNEDAGFVRTFQGPDRTVVVIADGVSSCDVGSGGVASRIACRRLEASLGPDVRAEEFFLRVSSGCAAAADEMLKWAFEHGGRDRLIQGADLMGTTTLAAWLEEGTLRLANVGDSRGYLIDATGIEQLTVDGDLGNALLAAGVPPEELRELGGAAYSLYSYVGGCSRDGQGEPDVGEHAEAELSLYPLLPGDTIILCSDGLVEEGAFLEPAELLALVRRHAGLSAPALAEKLAEAADARQHLPSEAEPAGRGDNITCCVIQVSRRA